MISIWPSYYWLQSLLLAFNHIPSKTFQMIGTNDRIALDTMIIKETSIFSVRRNNNFMNPQGIDEWWSNKFKKKKKAPKFD